MVPLGVMRPTVFPLFSVNQSAPSGPAVMPQAKLSGVGIGNSVMVRSVVDARDIGPLSEPECPVGAECSAGIQR